MLKDFRLLPPACAAVTGLSLICLGALAMAQTVLPTLDPNEKVGERPYEMVWAKRAEVAPPTIKFDDLTGWTMNVSGGAEASLEVTRAENVWDRPVARLRYRSTAGASSPRIEVRPPAPIPVPDGADCVEMWVFGNRWDWANPPGTPPVSVVVRLRDAAGQVRDLGIDNIRWEEWWLMHRRLPGGLKAPVVIESLVFSGGSQPEWRAIYLDSLRCYREVLKPLTFLARPKRNLTLFPGQDGGANKGPGRLPFPTREETILPEQLAGAYRNSVEALGGSLYRFAYVGKDARITYTVNASAGLQQIVAQVDGASVGTVMANGGVRLADKQPAGRLVSAKRVGDRVDARYTDGTLLRFAIRQKSLIVDAINKTGLATDLSYGELHGVTDPQTLYIPPITYGGSHPMVLLSRAGRKPVFTSIWMDWYRSNGSEPYGSDYAGGSVARINGGVAYRERTDGKRNPLFERVFVTVSPMLEEALPVVPNPPALHGKEASERLWQESWGPDDFAKQAKRSEMLRSYGIRKLIQCNHEISWRDNGESFTLRVHAAPKKGGDEAQKRYVAHQRSLGWNSGLYTNYTDFAPVNEHWDPDYVQRETSGEWRSAWPRCWALKPLRAVELDAKLAPEVHRRYGTNSAYTDVQTAVAPWGYNDYDARVPGGGTFGQTIYAYGELLRNDSRVYRGPIFSEGTYHWFYAGLADGNYGHTYNGHNAATDPLLPVFDLMQIHSKECDIGVSWTSAFCEHIPNWSAPDKIDHSIDRFLLHVLAYGHIGWLVEEEHGIQRTCRSYYMLQQVQALYGLQKPTRMAYWDGIRLRSVSAAVVLGLPKSRRQLFVAYPSGLQLWLNDHPTESWNVTVAGRRLTLPPSGWAAWAPGNQKSSGLFSYSALEGGRRVDYLRSGAYVFVDGRGTWFRVPEGGATGSIAVMPSGANRLEIVRPYGDGEIVVARPFGVKGRAVKATAFASDGKALPAPTVIDSGRETRIDLPKDAVRCEVTFDGRSSWSIYPDSSQVVPGVSVRLNATGKGAVRWAAEGVTIDGDVLHVPADAVPGAWIPVIGRRGVQERQTYVRVCEPVRFTWDTTRGDAVELRVRPEWLVPANAAARGTLAFEAPAGWSVSPASMDVRIRPAAFAVAIRSDAQAGASGDVAFVYRLAGREYCTLVPVRRVELRDPVVDLTREQLRWGIAFRHGTEVPGDPATGAMCLPRLAAPVGGVQRDGIFMHPPYNGGVGYTWGQTEEITLPAEPCSFHSFVGIMDGGDKSDGVVFTVEVKTADGKRTKVASQLGLQKEWRELSGDLTPWSGQKIRLILVADVGPADNSAADWAMWGEPKVMRARVRTVTEVLPPR